VKIAAIVTAYKRIEQTLATLRVIQSCTPPPDEILVHIDANEIDCEEAVQKAFPMVRVLRGDERLGPGGGRNKLVDAAQFEFVASFDDDSYPDASVICAALYHVGESIGLDERSARWTADFTGGACIYRRQAFLDAGGYVPLRVAYGMEEVDLALRLHSRGGRILTTSWLRVFHNNDLRHHADPQVTAGSIANLALLAYLRYPVSLWAIGAGQCANRLLWLLRHGRYRGILKGVTMIPAHLRAHHSYRLPLSKRAVRSYLALRRAPLPANLR
jgi:GT2 family glycosyltransferase